MFRRRPRLFGFAASISVFSLSLCPTLHARQAVREHALSGIVRDGSGAVVPRPTVVLRGVRSGLTQVVAASSLGEFSVSELPPGQYVLTVSAPGFADSSQIVDLPASGTTTITLSPAPVLEHVAVVSASRQNELRDTLNTRVDVVSRNRIEESGAFETVGEVLREIPGVVTRRGSETAGAAGEQIQGIDSRQVLVLLDGQPLVGARGIKRGGLLNLDRQSTARLDRVEVVKGAASTLYGSEAIGGVINLITREPGSPFEGTVAMSGGSLGTVGARVDGGFRRVRTFGLFSGERHQHDGFDLTPTTFDTTGAPYRRYDGLGKVQHQFTDTFSLSGLVTGYRNATAGRSNGELGPQTDDIRDRAVSASVAARYVAGGTSVEARAYLSDFEEEAFAMLAPPRATAAPPASLEQRYQKFDLTATRPLGTRHLLQGGVEWAHDHYEGTNRIRDEDAGHKAETLVGWLQHRWSATRRLVTTAGMRVDRRSSFETAVSPKLAASYRLSDAASVRASYGRGFRAPDLGQLYYRFLSPSNFYQVIGNPDLEPEYAHSWQVGGDVTLARRRVRLGVNAFRNDVRDLIESTTVGFAATPAQLAALLAREGIDPSFRPALGRPLLTYRNLVDVVTQGLEFDAEAALTSAVSIGAAYTYLDASDAESGRELTGRHRHHGHARVAWQPASIGLRTGLRATFFSSWIAARATQAGAVQDTVAPRFALWDVFATQRIGRGLSAFVNVDNLADSQDPGTGVLMPDGAAAPIFRPDAGRTIRFGLQWSFDAR